MDKVFRSGKHRGETHESVADEDPSYIVHLYEKGNRTIDSELYKSCVDAVEEAKDDNSYKELEL